MSDNNFKSSELQKLRDRIKKLFAEIKVRFYVVEGSQLIYEFLDYPYRLIAVADLVKADYSLNEKYIKNLYLPEDTIMDSGIFDDKIGNKLILKTANKLKPKYIVPKDYLKNSKKTLKSVTEFMEMKDSYLDGDNYKFLIPLQIPWNIDKSLMKFDYFGIGGISSISTPARRRAIKSVVSRYKDKNFHLFGLKLTTIPELLNNYPNIVSTDIAIAKKTFYNKNVYLGEYSSMAHILHHIFYVVNDMIGYYNYKTNATKEKRMF